MVIDLQKDLLICEKATLGPWMAVDWFVYTDDAGIQIADCDFGSDGNPDGDENSAFIVAAREGWPEAINRAIAAEAEVERLQAQRTEDIQLMEETLEIHKLSLATITKLRKALALAHSIILGCEQHTEQSKQVIEGALGLR